MVHVCAVATSVCFLYKHKYARFYFILLLLNCVLVPFTVGLISSGTIGFRNSRLLFFRSNSGRLPYCKLDNGYMDGPFMGYWSDTNATDSLNVSSVVHPLTLCSFLSFKYQFQIIPV